MSYVHCSVGIMSTKYKLNERRFNYTTPKTFLEQLYLYEKLLKQKKNENEINVERFQNGIRRLIRCAEQVQYQNCFYILLSKLCVKILTFKRIVALVQM